MLYNRHGWGEKKDTDKESVKGPVTLLMGNTAGHLLADVQGQRQIDFS